MKTSCSENAALIAVPYYGTLAEIPSRLTRIFFLVQVDLRKKIIGKLSLEVWNPSKDAGLSCWLRKMGADGVICSDIPSQQKEAFRTDGIWVQLQQEGDVHEVVERWMHGVAETKQKPLYRPARSYRATNGAWQFA